MRPAATFKKSPRERFNDVIELAQECFEIVKENRRKTLSLLAGLGLVVTGGNLLYQNTDYARAVNSTAYQTAEAECRTSGPNGTGNIIVQASREIEAATGYRLLCRSGGKLSVLGHKIDEESLR